MLTWDECIERYQSFIIHREEVKRKTPQIYEQAWSKDLDIKGFLNNIEQMRDDVDFSKLILNISHLTLGMSFSANRQFEVYVAPLKENIVCVGLSGCESVLVPLEKMLITIKYYVNRLWQLEQSFADIDFDNNNNDELQQELKMGSLPK